jgi:hypothetical protein
MPRTKRMTATRRASKTSPRRDAMTVLRTSAAALPRKLSPSTRRKVRQGLPIAAAIVVGGAAISTTIAMRRQLSSIARAVGVAGAAGWKSVADAVPVDRWLVQTGLRRRPLWIRALPTVGVAAGLLVSGALAFLFAPRGESVQPQANGAIEADELSSGGPSSSLSNSFAEHEPAHGHG